MNGDLQEEEYWQRYTHDTYMPVDDIRFRLSLKGPQWETLKAQIQNTRKDQSIRFAFPFLDLEFWYFASDRLYTDYENLEMQAKKLENDIKSHLEIDLSFRDNTRSEEAITSALYEGANTTRSRAKEMIYEHKTPITTGDIMAINNYITMNWIKDNLDHSINTDLILKLHAMITHNTLEPKYMDYSGRFRDDRVFVGPHEGIAYSRIPEAIEKMLDHIQNHPRKIPQLFRAIFSHYWIAYIHPFFDGNGRTARALFYFLTMKADLHYIELLSLSSDFALHGKRYERSYELAAQYDLDMTYFLQFNVDALTHSLKHAQHKVNRLHKIHSIDVSENNKILLTLLTLNKFRWITIQEYADTIGRTHESARNELKELQNLNLLRQRKKKKKLYFAIHVQNMKDILSKI